MQDHCREKFAAVRPPHLSDPSHEGDGIHLYFDRAASSHKGQITMPCLASTVGYPRRTRSALNLYPSFHAIFAAKRPNSISHTVTAARYKRPWPSALLQTSHKLLSLPLRISQRRNGPRGIEQSQPHEQPLALSPLVAGNTVFNSRKAQRCPCYQETPSTPA